MRVNRLSVSFFLGILRKWNMHGVGENLHARTELNKITNTFVTIFIYARRVRWSERRGQTERGYAFASNGNALMHNTLQTTASQQKIKNESIHRFVATVGRLRRWYCRCHRRLSHSCLHPWLCTFNRRSECIRVCADTRGAAKCNQANNERNGRAREAIKELQWPATAHRIPPPPNSCSVVHFISERNTNF